MTSLNRWQDLLESIRQTTSLKVKILEGLQVLRMKLWMKYSLQLSEISAKMQARNILFSRKYVLFRAQKVIFTEQF